MVRYALLRILLSGLRGDRTETRRVEALARVWLDCLEGLTDVASLSFSVGRLQQLVRDVVYLGRGGVSAVELLVTYEKLRLLVEEATPTRSRLGAPLVRPASVHVGCMAVCRSRGLQSFMLRASGLFFWWFGPLLPVELF